MKFKVDQDFILREIAGSNIIISTGTKAIRHTDMLEISDTGALLWKILSKKACDLDELCEAIMQEYEVSIEEVQKDVLAFIKEMMEEGVIINE